MDAAISLLCLALTTADVAPDLAAWEKAKVPAFQECEQAWRAWLEEKNRADATLAELNDLCETFGGTFAFRSAGMRRAICEWQAWCEIHCAYWYALKDVRREWSHAWWDRRAAFQDAKATEAAAAELIGHAHGVRPAVGPLAARPPVSEAVKP